MKVFTVACLASLAHEAEALTRSEAEGYRARVWSALIEVAHRQSEHQREANPVVGGFALVNGAHYRSPSRRDRQSVSEPTLESATKPRTRPPALSRGFFNAVLIQGPFPPDRGVLLVLIAVVTVMPRAPLNLKASNAWKCCSA
jgi:hypothetical protein